MEVLSHEVKVIPSSAISVSPLASAMSVAVPSHYSPSPSPPPRSSQTPSPPLSPLSHSPLSPSTPTPAQLGKVAPSTLCNPSAAATLPTSMAPALGITVNVYGQSVVALQSLKTGTQLFVCTGPFLKKSTAYTLQLDDFRHIITTGFSEVINHSCKPNAFFKPAADGDSLVCIANTDIQAGEHITVNYNCTEWDILEFFTCFCNTTNCCGQVRGFRHLGAELQQLCLPLATPFIQKKASQVRPVTHLIDIVDSANKGKSVVANCDIKQGQTIYIMQGHLQSFPVRETVQITEDKHIWCSGGAELTNHSCNANAHFAACPTNPDTLMLVAVRSIAEREEITFNYNTTEWSMASPFQCLCRSPNCVGTVQGFKFLSSKQRKEIAGQLSPYIRSQWLKSIQRVAPAELAGLERFKTLGPVVGLIETPFGKSVVACEAIPAGTKVYPFAGTIMTQPNMHTVQADDDRHVFCVGGPEFTSHSCDPNAYFAFDDQLNITLTTIRDVQPGEHITFNYNTTEWDMSCKFNCACQTAKCMGSIQGFKHLSTQERERMAAHISPFIRKQWERLNKHEAETRSTSASSSQTAAAAAAPSGAVVTSPANEGLSKK